MKGNTMNTLFRHLFTIIVLFLVFTALPVYGQEETSSSDTWEIRLMPYFWMPSIDADSTIDGETSSVDLSFDDVLDYLDFTVMGRVEFWKGKWGITLDTMYMELGADGEFELVRPLKTDNLDLDIELNMTDLGFAYRLFEQVSVRNPKSKIIFEPYGGLRYCYLLQEADVDTDIATPGPRPDISRGTTLGKSEDWVEPFIGARIICDLTDKVSIKVRGDAGGFDIGSASKLTWNFVAGIDYKLTKKMSLEAGYRILDIDYSRGSGSDKFGLDAKVEGPVIGMTFLFK
jgi:opacity protein-like surface antigen